MPSYNWEHYQPPAPVAEVDVRSPHTGATQAVVMLLDSGADVTLVPRSVIDGLRIVPLPGKMYELTGFHGTASFAPAVRLEMTFLGRTFRGQFLVVDQDHGILGRNVLNALPLFLDGPHLTWGELHSHLP